MNLLKNVRADIEKKFEAQIKDILKNIKETTGGGGKKKKKSKKNGNGNENGNGNGNENGKRQYSL
jgi:hypothetical protein